MVKNSGNVAYKIQVEKLCSRFELVLVNPSMTTQVVSNFQLLFKNIFIFHADACELPLSLQLVSVAHLIWHYSFVKGL